MPSFKEKLLELPKCSPKAMYEMLKKLILRFSNGFGMVDLERLFLPEDHPAIKKYFQEECTAKDQPQVAAASSSSSTPASSSTSQVASVVEGPQGEAKATATKRARAKAQVDPGSSAVQAAKKAIKSKTKKTKWPRQHLDIAAKSDIDWSSRRTVVTPALKKQFPGFATLSARELDVLAVKGVRPTEPRLRLIDTSQSLGRGAKAAKEPRKPLQSQKVVGCVTPTQRLWITVRSRHLHGLEAPGHQLQHHQPRS